MQERAGCLKSDGCKCNSSDRFVRKNVHFEYRINCNSVFKCVRTTYYVTFLHANYKKQALAGASS